MTFNTNPITQAEQAEIEATYGPDMIIPDWAESLTRARIALRELDDAFPRSDAEACKAAWAEFQAASDGIRQFLTFRKVM